MSRQEMIDVAPHHHLRMLAAAYGDADSFDIIHSHLDIWTLPFARESSTPTVLTMHGRLDLDHVQRILPLYPTMPLVSISNDQRRVTEGLGLNWAATVYNGLDLHRYHAMDNHDAGYLAFVGRIHPEKGPALAVDVARRARRPLRVAAKIDPLDVEYYQRSIAPLFAAHDVDFVGELHEPEKPAFYANATATLFPSDWPEPFGLVLIESMAAGTPVIALRRGSVPEIVLDGETGFICDTVEQMAEAVKHVDLIDRAACRRQAARFDAPHMCADYETVYRAVSQAPEASARWHDAS
jgi:glycosyltransferase involved in cell wall biosynthesis